MNRLFAKFGIWILAGVVILVLPWIFTSGFALSLLGQMGLAIIFALAYNMLLGQGGMLSFGHAIYFGLSGYFTIHFLNVLVESENAVFPVSLLPLLGGFVAMFFLLKRLKMDNLLALVGGIAYAFSGYLMLQSVDWYHLLDTALFLPLIFLLQLQNIREPSKKSALCVSPAYTPVHRCPAPTLQVLGPFPTPAGPDRKGSAR